VEERLLRMRCGMPSRGENEGVRVLDDFVCEAIPAPGIPQAEPTNQGKNEGMVRPAPHRRRCSALLLASTLVGAVAGFVGFLAANEPPNPAVLTVVSGNSRSGMNATLDVVFFGWVGYIRTSPNPGSFDAEVAFWFWAPPILAVLGGALAGGIAGHSLDRSLRSRAHAPEG